MATLPDYESIAVVSTALHNQRIRDTDRLNWLENHGEQLDVLLQNRALWKNTSLRQLLDNLMITDMRRQVEEEIARQKALAKSRGQLDTAYRGPRVGDPRVTTLYEGREIDLDAQKALLELFIPPEGGDHGHAS
jgi:hypothetical protein